MTPIIIFHQTPREVSRHEDADLYSAKGSGEIEHVSKIFISLNEWDRTKLPEELLTDKHSDILGAYRAGLIRILRVTMEKKKYGLDQPTIPVLMNKKSLEMCEFHPKKELHKQFMDRVKVQHKLTKDLFKSDPETF